MNFRIIKFFIEESIISIKQNLLMSLVSIMTVSVSLIVLAAFTLLFININGTIKNVSNNLTLTVYLDKNITTTGISKVQDQLMLVKGLNGMTFMPKEEAWRNLKEKFKYQSDVVGLITNNPLPDSFTLKLASISDVDKMVKELNLIEGITDIRYGKGVVSRIRRFVQIFNYGGLAIVGFLLLATFLIIINTINLTILAKRKEVEIMKLVGATNNYIKWSFMLEGFIIGFFGSIIAIIFVNSVFKIVTINMQTYFPFIGLYSKNVNMLALSSLLLVIGLFIGILGSSISIHVLLKSIIKK
ncbi:MAG: hypothetical protein A2Y40_06825 [Candidatus Margulisbacteria bacterium GWF2_35_9]|nr:MAG: hypothetical protein A2Y40_06825 [Candidatus Margulisbacteria bacterium GWF2_35_9]